MDSWLSIQRQRIHEAYRVANGLDQTAHRHRLCAINAKWSWRRWQLLMGFAMFASLLAAWHDDMLTMLLEMASFVMFTQLGFAQRCRWFQHTFRADLFDRMSSDGLDEFKAQLHHDLRIRHDIQPN